MSKLLYFHNQKVQREIITVLEDSFDQEGAMANKRIKTQEYYQMWVKHLVYTLKLVSVYYVTFIE